MKAINRKAPILPSKAMVLSNLHQPSSLVVVVSKGEGHDLISKTKERRRRRLKMGLGTAVSSLRQLCLAVLLLATSSLQVALAREDLAGAAAATTASDGDCLEISSKFSAIELLYGREIVFSTKEEHALVLLSDLAWGVVQYLQRCEPNTLLSTPLSVSEEVTAKKSELSGTPTRYLHLLRQEPVYSDITWPANIDQSSSTVQHLTEFMAANTPTFSFNEADEDDEDDDDEDDEDDVNSEENDDMNRKFPDIFIEMPLIRTNELNEDGTWQGLYSYTPWGFLYKLTERKTQWKNSYQLHLYSMNYFNSLRNTFSFFQAFHINSRADVADRKLLKYKKMSKRRQKKTNPTYARRLLSSFFQLKDNMTVVEPIPYNARDSADANLPFLKAHGVDSVEFAIARQYIDAHTELAMHMTISSLSVSKEVTIKNRVFDFYQCARTLDRLLIAADLFTSAIEALYRFSQEAHGIGSYKSMEVLFSRGFSPTSTHIFGLMKNLILATEHVVSRVGFFVRSPQHKEQEDLFTSEVKEEDRLILHTDFISGHIVNIDFLDLTRDTLIKVTEEFLRLAKGLSEDDLFHYQNLINITSVDLEKQTELFVQKETKLREKDREAKEEDGSDTMHVEL